MHRPKSSYTNKYYEQDVFSVSSDVFRNFGFINVPIDNFNSFLVK